MGQLTASDFQTYDPNAAGAIEPGQFALFSVSLSQILPTQMNEGLAEVDSKIAGWDLLTPAEVQSTLLTDVEPVVIGPGGQLYLLNGHHTFTSLSESIYGPGNPTVFVNVVANFSNLTTDQFWTQMLADNLLLPVDNGVPQTVNPSNGSPIPTSLTALTDDPYRGLEHSILKNKDSVLFPSAGNLTGAVGASIPGLDKMNGFYADFIWAEAYRNANGSLGLSYLSPGDIALSTAWNLNPNSTTTMPGVGTVKVSQLPGFILGQDITIATTISNATLATGTLGGDGTFDGITSFNFGPVTLGTPQSGFVMQLGADAKHVVTLSGANTYTGGTTILAGTLVVANDAALGASAPATYTIDPSNIAASVEAANGIIFNSLDEGAGTLRIGSSFSTNRPIAVDGETATIDLNSKTLTLTGSIVSLGSDGDGIGDESGVSDLSINDSGSGGKLILAPTSGANPGFFGNWIITNGTLQVSSDAALGNTAGPADEIGQIVLDGGTLQAGASFASVRSLSLTSGSTFDTNGFTTSFSGSLTDIQRTMTVANSSTTAAGAVTFGSFNVGATAILALSGGTKGETVTFTNGIDRVGNATLFIDPSTTTSLGTTEKVLSTTAPTLTDGIVAAWMITDDGAGAGSNPYDFLTYGANGFVKATYSKSSVVGASATDTVEQTAKVTLAASAQANALKVDSGMTITATGQTLTLGDGTDAAGLILSNSVITGGTIAFRGSEATIFAKGNSNTISGALTGTGGLTLSGSGTLVLSAVSTLSGAVNIDSGMLSLTTANALANVSGVDLSNVKSSPSNAILNFTASQTFAELDSEGTNSAITFNNGAKLTVGNGADLDSTLSAAITETGAATAGALTKNGTGLLDLSGMSSGKLNLIAGSTIAVNGGDLRVIAKSFANANGISLAAGSELQFAENGGDVFAGNVTGAGDVRLIGGTLKLTGTGQTYSGGTFVEAGSTLLLTTNNVSSGNANIGVADGQVVFDQTSSGTYAGVISDALQMGIGPLMPGTLIKDDSSGGNGGNVTLSQAQAFSGTTYIEAGTLTLAAVNTLAQSAGVVLGRVSGGAIANLALAADNELAALTDDASNTTTVQLNGHALTLAPAAGTISTYDGAIVDGAAPGGKVVDDGAGTVVLGGDNTFTGGTTLEAGTLELANSDAAGTGAITFAGSANLKIDLGDAPANTLFGFGAADTIDLAGIGFFATGGAQLEAGNVLAVVENGQTYDLQLDPNASFAGEYFHLAADADGTGAVITEQAVPQLTVNGNSPTSIGLAGANHVAFAVTGLVAGDSGQVTFTDADNNTVVVAVAGGQSTYSADLSGLADGTITSSLSIAANAFEIVAGNSVTLDQAPPTVSVSINSTDVNLAHSTATVSFAFSAAPTTFTLADTSAVGGTLSGLQQIDATDFSATFTAAANTDTGNASVSVVAGSWQEANGNAGLGGSTGNFVVDTVTPTVAVSINSTDVNLAHSTATVSFAFSEAPTAFTLADTSAVGGMLSGLQQVDATDYTAIFTAAANTDISNASVSVVSGSWQEANGNPGLGGSTGTFVVDTVTPTIESVTSQQGTFQTGSVIDIVFTMNEATSVSGGTPTLTLNDGGIAFFDAAHSTPTSLVFDYTVGAHDTSSALAITALNTNGATFQDPAGNVANLAAAKAQLPGTFVNVSPNGNDTLTTGADATVNLGNGNDTVTAGADSTVKLGNGNDKVTAGDDSTISLGNGNDLVFTGANSTVTAGNGNHTVTAGTGSTISLGDGNHTVTAGDGSTISLGNGNDVVYAGANTSIMFGSGNNTVFAGASDTITLGKGNELVAFGVNPSPLTIGNEVVNGFAKGDTLEFNHALVGNFSTLMSDARQMGADTVITLDQHDSVTLKGVAVTSISSSSVKFT